MHRWMVDRRMGERVGEWEGGAKGRKELTRGREGRKEDTKKGWTSQLYKTKLGVFNLSTGSKNKGK